MKESEKTFADMQEACILFLIANKNKWITFDFIEEEFNELDANYKALQKAIKDQTDSTTSGEVDQKRNDLNALAEPFHKICRCLVYLAKKSNDRITINKVDYSESSLIKGEEKEVIARLRMIIEIARTKLDLLAKYLVTAASLDELEAKLNKVAAMPETITLLKGAHKSATNFIKELNSKARDILENLDDVLVGVIHDDTFMNGWNDSRKIKGRPSGGKKNNDAPSDIVPPAK